MGYEWDEKKAASNLRKHGVDFADAVFVLEDEFALTQADDYPHEERIISLSADALGRILMVVYNYRGENIRIFSARDASPRERRQYTGGI